MGGARGVCRTNEARRLQLLRQEVQRGQAGKAQEGVPEEPEEEGAEGVRHGQDAQEGNGDGELCVAAAARQEGETETSELNVECFVMNFFEALVLYWIFIKVFS